MCTFLPGKLFEAGDALDVYIPREFGRKSKKIFCSVRFANAKCGNEAPRRFNLTNSRIRRSLSTGQSSRNLQEGTFPASKCLLEGHFPSIKNLLRRFCRSSPSVSRNHNSEKTNAWIPK